MFNHVVEIKIPVSVIVSGKYHTFNLGNLLYQWDKVMFFLFFIHILKFNALLRNGFESCLSIFYIKIVEDTISINQEILRRIHY